MANRKGVANAEEHDSGLGKRRLGVYGFLSNQRPTEVEDIPRNTPRMRLGSIRGCD